MAATYYDIIYMNWSDGMKNKKNITTILLIFMFMFIAAMIENIRGIFIPLFKQDFQVKDTYIGIMTLVSSIAYMIFSYIGGGLCERLGQKKVYIGGFIFTMISLMVLANTYSFPMLLLGMFLMNIGLSLASIATNTLVPLLMGSFQAVLMNLTHFCYGVGSTIGQSTVGNLISKGINWRQIYLGEAFLVLLLIIGFSLSSFPEHHKENRNLEKKKVNIWSNKLVYFFILALGFYIFAEVGTGNWLVNYLKGTYGFSEQRGSMYLALFFGIFTIGRLVGGFIVEKTGYLNTVAISLVAATIVSITGLIIGEKGMVVLSLSGFFFSIAFPTIVLTISKVFKNNTSYITGVIMTAGSLINMLLNALVGVLNDNIGIYKTFFLIPISLLISAVFIIIIHKNIGKASKSVKAANA